MAITYRKATSGRLVLLISRFVQSLSLAILISQKSLGNHPDNPDANALTCAWRAGAVARRRRRGVARPALLVL